MSFGGLFDVKRKKQRLGEIEQLEAMKGFWEDVEAASKIQKEKSILKNTVDLFQNLVDLKDEFEILYEYLESDSPESSYEEVINSYHEYCTKFKNAEKKLLLSDELDSNNAIISINAGAGGTESCDWAEMLSRMIQRWSENKLFKLKSLDYQPGDTAGLKSTTFLVEGDFAYGLLKSEIGVHRLVRISPFDSSSRRHTSFASIFVSPEIDENIEIEINDKDLKIDVFRAGGAGGQSVNTTDSAVRMTHLPTGIVVTCQNERSQLQNKAQAMKVLRSRIFDLELEKKRAESEEQESQKMEIGWGAQIRSYVLHPYKLVKDHRTNSETSNAEKVLDGDLDQFIDSFLRWRFAKED